METCLGTEPVQDTIRHLEPVSDMTEVILDAKKSGYVHTFQAKVENASYIAINPTSVSISWEPVENECFEKYVIEVKKGGKTVEKSFVGQYSTTLTFSSLEPCTDYTASVNIYLGLDDSHFSAAHLRRPKSF